MDMESMKQRLEQMRDELDDMIQEIELQDYSLLGKLIEASDD